MRVRLWIGEQRAFLVCALVFAVVAGIALTMALTGPSRVQWTGVSVHGTETDGTVGWSYQGASGSFDRTSRFSSTTVYLDPADPEGTARLDYPLGKLFEALTVLGPLVLSVVFVAASVVRERRRRRRSRQAAADSEFGHGLDPVRLRAIIDRNRA
jgi:hypothetical protein